MNIHQHTNTESYTPMKQRVVVQAIIQSGDKTLLLRRSQGRPGIVGMYELPGGTLNNDEQPEDGMKRHLHNDVGLTIKTLRLHDVMSLHSREDTDIQHVFIAYTVSEVGDNEPIRLGQSYDEFVWKKKQEIQQMRLRDSATTLLNLYVRDTENAHDIKHASINKVNNTSNLHRFTLYSDGGSRGNPGPSAAAFVILDNHQEVIDSGGAYLGITTNNQAEYQGVRLGLERALERGIRHVEFRVDSMLVVNQLKGIYKIKNRELWPINERIGMLIAQFESARFVHVPREQNQLADGLVNKFLDEHKNDRS